MSIKCISCGNSTHYQLHNVKEMMYGLRENFTYFECLECGCLQIVDIPASMDKYFDEKYYSFQRGGESNLTKKIINLLIRERNRYSLFRQGILGQMVNIKYRYPFGELLKKYGIEENWNILDIGPNTCEWLFSLNDLGFKNLYGVGLFIDDADLNNDSVNIIKGTIYELKNLHQFNLIRSSYSLEHISDQYETLRKIHDLLAPDGLCVIAMPVKTETIWKKYGTNWVRIDAPRHLVIHSVTSFRILAKKAGFEITDVIFDSTAFQFWGSEQYTKDIPLKSANSYKVSPNNSMFSPKMIQHYSREAERLNLESQGDQAIYILKPLGD